MTSSGTTAESARSIACQIDGIDTCILNMLEKDGRATLAQLSEATGLSVSAVQSRVQKLERRGVISGHAHRACGIAKQARRAAQRHSPNRSGKHRNHDRAAALLREVAVLW